MFTDIGKDESEMIKFNEFIELITGKINSQRFFFNFLTMIKRTISFQDLKRVCTELGETLTDKEMHEIIDEADRDGDGLKNEKEFFRVIKKRNRNPLDDPSDDD
ncbi:calcium-dependent protein 5 [Plasmopara halstedii]|uniref:Calcium-dependent protein 5 n=1 Tax=Plasmopara halstedii TaxID=4781 RepID=A0A0P1AX80_PLAHL|nr:calcium-dependent protein 5 [Plasmopara halstedii]CEG45231.1 calcium-dependent protein 5 [Plasmopara halstedii]|eukprot:XP_024581600.1 calcium-dependent protein 5 [Plasmopara halstedii]